MHRIFWQVHIMKMDKRNTQYSGYLSSIDLLFRQSAMTSIHTLGFSFASQSPQSMNPQAFFFPPNLSLGEATGRARRRMPHIPTPTASA